MLEQSSRQPAEWEPHDATWLAWPALADEWGKALTGARQATIALAQTLAQETVRLLVPPGRRTQTLEHPLLAGLPDHIECVEAPYGDTWLRDTGPIFVRDPQGSVRAHCFKFNGWGQKYIFEGDEQVAEAIAESAGTEVRRFDFVLEGGAVESDGQGTLITTRQCLVRGERNAGVTESSMATLLQQALGVRQVIWLDRGLLNDHTDGHVDTLARFVGPGIVVCMVPEQRSDPNREALLEVARVLRKAVDCHGRVLEVVELPSPGCVVQDGVMLPASYCNFYLGNGVVAVPVYGSKADARALDTIARLFPERRAVAIDCRDLLTGGGALHCISQQQPQAWTGETP